MGTTFCPSKKFIHCFQRDTFLWCQSQENSCVCDGKRGVGGKGGGYGREYVGNRVREMINKPLFPLGGIRVAQPNDGLGLVMKGGFYYETKERIFQQPNG